MNIYIYNITNISIYYTHIYIYITMDIAIYVSLDIFLFVGQDALLSELRAS